MVATMTRVPDDFRAFESAATLKRVSRPPLLRRALYFRAFESAATLKHIVVEPLYQPRVISALSKARPH